MAAQFQNLSSLGSGMPATGRSGWTRTVYKDSSGNVRLETNLGPTSQMHDLETVNPTLYGDVITFLGLDKATGSCGLTGTGTGSGGAGGGTGDGGATTGSGGATGTGGATAGSGGMTGAGGATGSGGMQAGTAGTTGGAGMTGGAGTSGGGGATTNGSGGSSSSGSGGSGSGDNHGASGGCTVAGEAQGGSLTMLLVVALGLVRRLRSRGAASRDVDHGASEPPDAGGRQRPRRHLLLAPQRLGVYPTTGT